MQKSLVFISWCYILLISSFLGENQKTMAQNSFKSQNSAFEKIDNDKNEVEFILDKTLRGHSAGVQNIRFSPDGKWIASASLDRTIIIWDVKTGILRHRLRSHSASVYEVTFNKKGNLLASASEDGTVCLWDSRYGKLLGTYKNKPLSLTNGLILRSASFVVFSPDDKYLYFGGDNGYIMRVRIDIPNQIPMQVFSINSEKDLLSNTITGGTIASTEKELIFSVDHYVYSISLQNHKLVRRFHYSKSDINDIVIGANKNQITGWAFDGMLVIWDYFSAQKVDIFKVSPKENYSAASYSKNGNWVATGANGKIAKIWNVQTKENLAILSEHKKIVRVCRFSPTENGTVATASYDGRVYIWKEKNEKVEVQNEKENRLKELEKQQEKILAEINQLKERKDDNQETEISANQGNEKVSAACDTVFVDRIVEKVVEKPIYLEAKNNDSENLSNIELEKPKEIIKEKIIYVRDTVYIRDTVYQKVFVKADEKSKSIKNNLTANNKNEVVQNPLENEGKNKEDYKEEIENKNQSENNATKQKEESEFDKQFVVGKTLNLHNIQFKQGTSTLLSGAYSDLEKLLAILKKYPKMKISLGGHTDNVGLHTVNLRLSGERVRTVQNYLVSHGIPRSRIQTRAYGGKYPIASNSEEETRKLNRRVEITVLSK
ncbi:OmpA family protein [Bernardetia sp. ABR2-2B]|uniref:OmpA family protein n=1 Tax=Bernardetia sp. ABR2-2B TaxID=3127472 RepID=UPI0030CCA24C